MVSENSRKELTLNIGVHWRLEDSTKMEVAAAASLGVRSPEGQLYATAADHWKVVHVLVVLALVLLVRREVLPRADGAVNGQVGRMSGRRAASELNRGMCNLVVSESKVAPPTSMTLGPQADYS